jgi:hypothetical protein
VTTQCDIVGCPGIKLTDMIVCRDHALSIWSAVQHANNVVPRVTPLTHHGHLIEGWIYYIRLDDKIKIGWTANLEKRLRSYPPHAEVVAEHPGTRADERDLHRSFKPSRAAGREWYYPTPEVMAHIEQARSAEMQRRMTEAAPTAGPQSPSPVPTHPA